MISLFISEIQIFIKKIFPSTFPFIYAIIATINFTLTTTYLKLLSPIPTYQLVTYRAIILLIINTSTAKKSKFSIYPKEVRVNKILIFRAFLGAVVVTCGFMGVQILPIDEFQTLMMTSPIWSIFVVKIFRISQSSLTLRKTILIFVNFVGLIIMINPNDIVGRILQRQQNSLVNQNNNEQANSDSIYDKPHLRVLGITLSLLGAISFSILTSITILLKGKTDPSILLQYFYAAGVLLGAIFMINFGIQTNDLISLKTVIYLIIVAVTSYIGQMCMNMALLEKPSTDILPITYLQIVYSFIIDILVFEGVFSFRKIIGASSIIFACITLIRTKQ